MMGGMSTERIAILGAGMMGETILAGLLRAGRSVDQVVISERRPDRAAELARRASVAVRRYDWSRVAGQVLDVYETVRLGADRVGADARAQGPLSRWWETARA